VPPLQGQLGLSNSKDAEALADLRDRASRRLDGTRDILGMRKMFLVATASGHLFALHSADGRVLWHAALPNGGLPLRTLRVLREPHSVEDDSEVRVLDMPLVCWWRIGPQ
jgi:hypothetical protein